MSKETLIKSAKKQLRTSLKKKLIEISADSINSQSIGISNSLIQVPQFKNAKKIALYMNMPNSEAQTMDIIKHCFDVKKALYLPKCNVVPLEGRKRNYLSMLEVSSYENVLQLEPQGKYNLLEPICGNDIMDTGDLDVIIVPGVAFTKSKKRLGHGAGFYDEFLNVYHKKFNRSPYLIGIGLEEQLVDEIPKEEHDWNMNCLVIGNTGVIR
ncbi:DEHA2D05742p [Debaryomyces hansenii CBS767]|uniref:5-formyltetrahydrofolate cyclo-ligase n=1 Tax=Debaryomyces hansenii (strain ATCC 36239 / CBS 767 / BCRC 21394 / JCM 1990 / NBRC 0083 / IGC 2968) TaxID=284592 RepID=Q6BSV4_DEBHA|nr:DEHA2D05742p [Debaryomyces hansenii CBS767]CAG86858.2 DEHA2D05742p [Debaryomyces hansenii CBS767]|eukprot:XP_458716.2 DEHA2D05742p [Debaryomyces hansenii CBS767]